MKKAYVKPVVIIENFTLSTNVAGDCEKPFNLQAQFVCGIPDEWGMGDYIFAINAGGNCTVDGNEDTKLDGFCYHVSSETNELFNS